MNGLCNFFITHPLLDFLDTNKKKTISNKKLPIRDK